MIIYHNPRCRKSRETLELIRGEGIEPEIVEYLKNPLKADEIKSLLKMLNLKASDIIRKGEVIYKEKFTGKQLTEEETIKILSQNPILMERPIVVERKKAVIGRPPENVKKLF